MKRQSVHALFPLYRVNVNGGRLARELDGRDNGIELGGIEVALKLLTRFPVFDEQ